MFVKSKVLNVSELEGDWETSIVVMMVFVMAAILVL